MLGTSISSPTSSIGLNQKLLEEEKKQEIKMIAESTSTNGVTRSNQKEGYKGTLSAIGSLIKLLPTGTVFVFQFANPIVTNSGSCNTTNKSLSSILLVVSAFCCVFSSFTDSYTGSDNKRHYGIVTRKGLYPSPGANSNIDLLEYRLQFGDFVHATLSFIVFATLGLLDANTVHCFYPDFESTQKVLLQVLPPIIGVLAGGAFMIFPNHRHGIGYPVSTDSKDTSPKSNDTETGPKN